MAVEVATERFEMIVFASVDHLHAVRHHVEHTVDKGGPHGFFECVCLFFRIESCDMGFGTQPPIGKEHEVRELLEHGAADLTAASARKTHRFLQRRIFIFACELSDLAVVLPVEEQPLQSAFPRKLRHDAHVSGYQTPTGIVIPSEPLPFTRRPPYGQERFRKTWSGDDFPKYGNVTLDIFILELHPGKDCGTLQLFTAAGMCRKLQVDAVDSGSGEF